MLFFQTPYKQEVAQLLADKEHISDGMGSEHFLYYILWASAFLFILSAGMSIYMLLLRRNKIKVKNQRELLIERYQEFLSGFLILPIDEAFLGIQKHNQTEHRLQPEDVADPYRRIILAEEIYALKKDLCGQQEQQLTNYFFGLGLQAEVLKMVRLEDWSKKIKAMQMIDSFGIEEGLVEIRSYINSENRELAIHAIVTMITNSKSINVLEEVVVALNDWEGHKIVATIKRLALPAGEVEKLLRLVNCEGSPLHRLKIGLRKEQSTLEYSYQN